MVEAALKKLSNELTNIPYEYCEDEIKQKINKIEIVSKNQTSNSSSRLSVNEIRKIIEKEIYFSKKKIEDKIKILKITHSNIYVYDLETFVQKRDLYSQFRRHQIKPIDDHKIGTIENTWNVKLPYSDDKVSPFVDHVEDVYVKHSEYSQPCICSNLTKPDCDFCGGTKILVYYLNCRISWHSYKDHYEVSEVTHSIPISKLKQAPGELIYEAQDKLVSPLKYAENDKISKASENLINSHRKKSSKEKIIQQKHGLKKVQVTTVHYEYKNKLKKFYILGDKNNREIHVPYSPTNTPFCIFL